jgi:hypothetical protein
LENEMLTWWHPGEHSDDENLRWSLIRAIEWMEWPLFVTQPIVPILLYFCDWRPILGTVLVATLLWRATVARWFVSAWLADLGTMFVLSRFLVCPLMAFLIWQQGDRIGAVLAFFGQSPGRSSERSQNPWEEAIHLPAEMQIWCISSS